MLIFRDLQPAPQTAGILKSVRSLGWSTRLEDSTKEFRMGTSASSRKKVRRNWWTVVILRVLRGNN